MIYGEYTHMKCECGGIIGMYDTGPFTCERCGKVHFIGNQGGKWDILLTNDKTGWIFPMIKRKDK